MAKLIEGSFPKGAPSTTEVHPKQEEIAVRAFEISIARGATPGQDLDDWLQAEVELSEKRKKLERMAKSV
jgi:hypothetical protein